MFVVPVVWTRQRPPPNQTSPSPETVPIEYCEFCPNGSSSAPAPLLSVMLTLLFSPASVKL